MSTPLDGAGELGSLCLSESLLQAVFALVLKQLAALTIMAALLMLSVSSWASCDAKAGARQAQAETHVHEGVVATLHLNA